MTVIFCFCFSCRFLPISRDPETSLRLIIQPTKGEELLRGDMRLNQELEAEEYSSDVCNIYLLVLLSSTFCQLHRWNKMSYCLKKEFLPMVLQIFTPLFKCLTRESERKKWVSKVLSIPLTINTDWQLTCWIYSILGYRKPCVYSKGWNSIVSSSPSRLASVVYGQPWI